MDPLTSPEFVENFVGFTFAAGHTVDADVVHPTSLDLLDAVDQDGRDHGSLDRREVGQVRSCRLVLRGAADASDAWQRNLK